MGRMINAEILARLILKYEHVLIPLDIIVRMNHMARVTLEKIKSKRKRGNRNEEL